VTIANILENTIYTFAPLVIYIVSAAGWWRSRIKHTITKFKKVCWNKMHRVIKYMYKTAVYTLVNGGIQGLTHQKQ